jgi:hypothetical protein
LNSVMRISCDVESETGSADPGLVARTRSRDATLHGASWPARFP